MAPNSELGGMAWGCVAFLYVTGVIPSLLVLGWRILGGALNVHPAVITGGVWVVAGSWAALLFFLIRGDTRSFQDFDGGGDG